MYLYGDILCTEYCRSGIRRPVPDSVPVGPGTGPSGQGPEHRSLTPGVVTRGVKTVLDDIPIIQSWESSAFTTRKTDRMYPTRYTHVDKH